MFIDSLLICLRDISFVRWSCYFKLQSITSYFKNFLEIVKSWTSLLEWKCRDGPRAVVHREPCQRLVGVLFTPGHGGVFLWSFSSQPSCQRMLFNINRFDLVCSGPLVELLTEPQLTRDSYLVRTYSADMSSIVSWYTCIGCIAFFR